MFFRCRECFAGSDRRWSSCPACGRAGGLVRLGFISDIKTEPEEEEIVKKLEQFEPVDGRRIDTGVPGLNRVLGASRTDPDKTGFHIPSLYLFGGGPGAGKTTLLTHMASRLMSMLKTGPGGKHGLLFISSEMHVEEINQMVRGLGLYEMLREMRSHYTQDFNELMLIIRKMDPLIVAIDSLNELSDPLNLSKDPYLPKVAIAKALREEAFQNNRGIILISHVNKDENFAGLQKLQHEVGATMMLSKAGGSMRMLQCQKNRYGDIEEQAWFKMGKRKFEEIENPNGPKPDEVEEIDRQEPSRKRRSEGESMLGPLMGTGMTNKRPRHSSEEFIVQEGSSGRRSH